MSAGVAVTLPVTGAENFPVIDELRIEGKIRE
jgi:hypothetical protein